MIADRKILFLLDSNGRLSQDLESSFDEDWQSKPPFWPRY